MNSGLKKTGIIYKATFPNNKVYIGKTVVKFQKRINRHLSSAIRKNSHEHNSKIAKAIRKYGKENIIWEVLYKDVNIDELNKLECLMIAQYDSRKNGYNSTSGGEGCSGYRHTKENKIKMGEKRKQKFAIGELFIGGEKSPAHILDWENVNEIRKLYKTGKFTQNKLAEMFEVSRKNISYIVHNQTWKDSNYEPKIFNASCKLNEHNVDEIRKLYITGNYSCNQLAKKYHVCFQLIYDIIANKSHKNEEYEKIKHIALTIANNNNIGKRKNAEG